MPAPVVHSFQVTIPAGTPIATPLVTPTVFVPAIVDSIAWRFPGGCNGQVGIQLGNRAISVLPPNRTQFLVQSGDSSKYDVSGFVDSGDWSVIGYNLGSFPHTIQIVFVTHRMQAPEPIPGYLALDAVDALQGGA